LSRSLGRAGIWAGAAFATVVGLLLAAAAPAASPTLTLTAADAVIGQTVDATAVLSEGPTASGEISFEVFGPDDPTCAGPALESSQTSASGEGQYASADFTPAAAGAYRWSARYAGDAENSAAEAPCAAVSTVAKASPGLIGAASAGIVGTAIRDEAAVTGGFSPTGEIVFSVFAPGDTDCSAPLDTSSSALESGQATSADFLPEQAGEFRWTATYSGDANNEAATLACGAASQSSPVGTIDVTLTAGATGATVGQAIEATATIRGGATPLGQIAFRAFPPGDADCSGAAAFSSVVGVSGNGSYRSAAFAPSRVGTFRWTAAYAGDPKHAPATSGCGLASSIVARAKPTIAGAVPRRRTVGTPFRDEATLQGAFEPGGTVTFRIYGPSAEGCARPAFVNTVAVSGNGTISSDPFVAQSPGRYSFVASYSGDAANQGATESCDAAGQVVRIRKRAPRATPRARLVGSRQISIRARLSGGASPSGALTFRLYGPGDERCSRKPAFSGGVTVKANGTFPLARYIATEAGVYRLSVGYSGDRRNQRYKGSCEGAQPIRVGQPS